MVCFSFNFFPGECRSDEYTCDNGRCIDQSLQCNGFNPCGDGSDCKRLHPGWKAAIAASTLGLVMLVIIIVQAVKLAKKNRQVGAKRIMGFEVDKFTVHEKVSRIFITHEF